MAVTINLRNFRRFIASFRTRMDRAIPRALNSSGNKVRELILDRTSRGVGLRGRFRPYSRKYAEYRSDNGRGQTPDLNFSGRMLSNIDVERKSATSVMVNFRRREEENKAANVQKKRPFFGIKPEEKQLIGNAFARQLRRDL